MRVTSIQKSLLATLALTLGVGPVLTAGVFDRFARPAEKSASRPKPIQATPVSTRPGSAGIAPAVQTAHDEEQAVGNPAAYRSDTFHVQGGIAMGGWPCGPDCKAHPRCGFFNRKPTCYPICPPLCDPNFGYYQNCWRRMPDLNWCPRPYDPAHGAMSPVWDPRTAPPPPNLPEPAPLPGSRDTSPPPLPEAPAPSDAPATTPDTPAPVEPPSASPAPAALKATPALPEAVLSPPAVQASPIPEAALPDTVRTEIPTATLQASPVPQAEIQAPAPQASPVLASPVPQADSRKLPRIKAAEAFEALPPPEPTITASSAGTELPPLPPEVDNLALPTDHAPGSLDPDNIFTPTEVHPSLLERATSVIAEPLLLTDDIASTDAARPSPPTVAARRSATPPEAPGTASVRGRRRGVRPSSIGQQATASTDSDTTDSETVPAEPLNLSDEFSARDDESLELRPLHVIRRAVHHTRVARPAVPQRAAIPQRPAPIPAPSRKHVNATPIHPTPAGSRIRPASAKVDAVVKEEPLRLSPDFSARDAEPLNVK